MGTKNTKTATAKVATTATATPKRKENMEAMGERLIKTNATEEQILAEFKAAYKLKGKTDMAFIKPRIAIYLNIGRKALGLPIVSTRASK